MSMSQPQQESESSNSISNDVQTKEEGVETFSRPENDGINDTIKSASDIPVLTPTSTTTNVPTQEVDEVESEGDNQLSSNNEQTQPIEQDHLDEHEWEDLLGNGQLMKKVLKTGAGISTHPTPQSRVKVRTKGTIDGINKVIDVHRGVVFTVGDGDVIPAWDLAVVIMERGEIAQVKTNARFAYGEFGKPPDVPSNANITYELELLEVMEPVNYSQVSETELIALVDKKRVRGNELFQRKEFDRAVEVYHKGLKMLDAFIEEQKHSTTDPPKVIQDMQIRCWNNMAAAQLKVEFFKEALESCEKVLLKDPGNVKALFRSGKVLSLSGNLDQAIERLQKAQTLNPEEKAIQLELQKAISKRKNLIQKEKEMYKRMLDGGAKPEKKKQPVKQPTDTWGPLPYLAAAAVVATVGIGLAYVLTQRH